MKPAPLTPRPRDRRLASAKDVARFGFLIFFSPVLFVLNFLCFFCLVLVGDRNTSLVTRNDSTGFFGRPDLVISFQFRLSHYGGDRPGNQLFGSDEQDRPRTALGKTAVG